MAAQQTNVMNAFEAKLSAEFGASDLTMSVEDSTGNPVAEHPPVPFYLVIDPLSENVGREYVLVDGSASTTEFTISVLGNRYLPRSSATSGLNHPAGTIIRISPMEQHIEDLNDRVSERLLESSHTPAQHEGMNLAHSSLSGLTTGDPHTQYLDGSRHTAIPHDDKLTIAPTGRKMTVGTSPHANPATNDLWVDTN